MRDVVARTPRQPRLAWGLLVTWTCLFTLFTVRLLGAVEWPAIILAVTAALGMAAAIARIVAFRSGQLVLTEEELRVERRRRPLTIARTDVRAVRGNVPNRPSWSDRVIVEHAGGKSTLPAYDLAPGLVIARLQQWAGVGELRGSAPAASPPSAATGEGAAPTVSP
ncbi:hypothetical protein [Isoptericola sp. NPDC057191]|uniref:hypothetical protein n=1 Tax=Isoptericola sp. NPDC057191 TaxID=3346041 RepID=UPI003633F37F